MLQISCNLIPKMTVLWLQVNLLLNPFQDYSKNCRSEDDVSQKFEKLIQASKKMRRLGKTIPLKQHEQESKIGIMPVDKIFHICNWELNFQKTRSSNCWNSNNYPIAYAFPQKYAFPQALHLFMVTFCKVCWVNIWIEVTKPGWVIPTIF